MSASAFTRLSELHAELARVYAELSQQPEPGAPEQRLDEVLRIREACARMSWSYSWAVKHWRELGGFKDSDGGLKIRAQVLARRSTAPSDLDIRQALTASSARGGSRHAKLAQAEGSRRRRPRAQRGAGERQAAVGEDGPEGA